MTREYGFFYSHTASFKELEGQQVSAHYYSRVCEDDTGPASVFDGELCLPVLPCDAADCPGEVVAVQSFDVLDFEGVEVEVV